VCGLFERRMLVLLEGLRLALGVWPGVLAPSWLVRAFFLWGGREGLRIYFWEVNGLWGGFVWDFL